MHVRTDSRHGPLPRHETGPWLLAMRWQDLLFAHWSLAPAALAPTLPAGLELDTRDGRAWLGVIPFRMSGVRLRGLPPLPGARAFPEANVRTYVRAGDRPGVWFYSLDAASRLAVAAARRWFHLPYVHARMQATAVAREGREDGVRYASRRTGASAREPGGAGELVCRYAPVGAPFEARPGTLEHWLTERYCLYSAAPDGRLLRGEIHHRPWPLQPAEADFERNDLAAASGLALPDERPQLLFARRLEVVAFAPRAVPGAGG
jgi:uncharacterized protein YqjF (DUF2071 family)